ncbi:glyoxylase-like metal-dependent hydrolase (beta-lactamase superfamily II) [Agrobacterium tumefaciens]|jgi:glyoxylase-like metal-dependent hydrolase (beta-lactamase superfamily II)|uniref:Glyoxylase-like metal-dependent hydrolase (Beta-lactamase superfamily II) n=1 Tax=Agrobacterium radiobacter TaxID=362 RepID=A0ABR6JDV1_AGRRD|nr:MULTISPECIES: MBL fold metallo-hydrolase [Agrobacterium tumefaciens complex]MCP2138093.1 glyoxylase-like metal-dependent hydrolase (beta-lactamase superfamily II) [Rhizobium sp. SLBN-94]MBB4321187.1 glyoxylase-like metal-dependent hydrolase (beta-lactamase superfamily II) [Agrobacterium radiobacter]MBB4338227.1 glyoxylase-like metal-dependent hydrolase (beta-lactamase superfamily II) [Agrobacterium radiobacter]MBB4493115.1 glyoxylase-like metal-dependent hydrolase (beta-lactamase superfamily
MNSEPTKNVRTTRDEIVPSRYVVNVGDIEVIIISDGILTPPAESMATNADPRTRNAWLDERFLDHDAFDWALNAVVVRSGNQTILIDSGLGEEYPSFPRAGQFVARLEAAGVDLASVTDVVLTHMHFDHVGGLLVQGVRDRLAREVRIHLSAAEASFWTNPDFSRTAMPPDLAELARSASKEFLSVYADNLMTFEQETEIAPGVVATKTGGHTPGHSVVRIFSNGEKLMFGGDALFPVSFDHPEWHNGFEHDPEEATNVRLRLMAELAGTGSWLVSTHLPFPSLGRVAPSEKLYRWVPAPWDY